MIKVKEIHEMEIIDLTDTGEGVAKLDGFTIFVDGAVPGDMVRVKITEVKKSYGKGRIIKLLSSSSDRVTPACPHAFECGGCQVMNLDYKRQLELKEDIVRNALVRIGGLHDFDMEPIIGMQHPYEYRNKTSIPIRNGKMGFYRKRSHDIVEITGCMIHDKQADKVLETVRKLIDDGKVSTYDEKSKKGHLRHVMIRTSTFSGEVMVVLVTRTKDSSAIMGLVKELESLKFVSTIVQNINTKDTNTILGYENRTLTGSGFIFDMIGDYKFKISPNSFFQVNSIQTEKLYGKALEYANLTGGETVYDLYSGIGTISLFLSQKAGKVYAIESVKAAVDDAEENRKINERDNVEFMLGKAEDEIHTLIKKGIKPDVVVVDPPRKGLERSLVEEIIELSPERIVYVSCKPSTLARDIGIFTKEGGYEVMKVQPVDMFPHSMHVETVVLMSRK